jgi:hypothetical protein
MSEIITHQTPQELNLRMTGHQVSAIADQALDIQSVLKQAHLIQQVMATVMKDGEHYGVIPGTTGNKKSLLKSGAEKLCFTFGLSNRLTIQSDNLPGGHREYRITCDLYDRAGNLRGQGVGSASTMESKHRYRGAAGKACPKCGSMSCRPGKKEYGGGYYCDQKAGGCGLNFKGNTAEAKGLDAIPSIRQENQDPADQYNTVLKMAKKRALVDAVLTATAASDIFAQDIEDLEDQIDHEDMKPATAKSAKVDPIPSGQAEDRPASTQSKPAPTRNGAQVAMASLYDKLEKIFKEWFSGLNDQEEIKKADKDWPMTIANRITNLRQTPGAAFVPLKAMDEKQIQCVQRDCSAIAVLETKEAIEEMLNDWERIKKEGEA